MAKFEDLLKIMRDVFEVDASREARLLVEEQVIEGPKLKQTLNLFGVSQGQVFYVEFFDTELNQWPTQNLKEREAR